MNLFKIKIYFISNKRKSNIYNIITLSKSCILALQTVVNIEKKKDLNVYDYYKDKFASHLWAKNLIDNDYFVILDTETTGYGPTDQIVEIAVVDKWGTTLVDTLIKPTSLVSIEAYNCHGIEENLLLKAPSFPEVYKDIKKAIEGKNVVIYNADFDVNKLAYMCQIHQLPNIRFDAECAMQQYADYYGQWHDYYCNYTWQKLPKGNHRAKGDAIACLNLIKKMASILSCKIDCKPASFPAKQLKLEFQKISWEILWKKAQNNKIIEEIEFTLLIPHFVFSEDKAKISTSYFSNHDERVLASISYQDWLKSDLSSNYNDYAVDKNFRLEEKLVFF